MIGTESSAGLPIVSDSGFVAFLYNPLWEVGIPAVPTGFLEAVGDFTM